MSRPTATAVKRGFRHACPRCAADDSLSVSLDDVAQIHCAECEETVTAAELRSLIADWTAILAWLEIAPERSE